MSVRSLPRNPNLELLKGQARQLLNAYRDGAPDAQQTFAAHPRGPSAAEAKLTDAQLVLARSYGFDSWPLLRREVVGLQLRRAIWDRDVDAVGASLDLESEALHEAGSHPMWGGRPDALQLAAERGQVEIVRLLLARGADVEGHLDGYGWSPLQLAAHWGHADVTEVLLQHGARLDICAAAFLGDADAVRRLLEEDRSRVTTPALSDAPPLHQAATRDVAELLLSHGASLETVDSMGNTPLGSAINRQDRGRAVAELLIERGAPADPCQLAALGLTDRLEAMVDADPSIVGTTGNIGVNAVVGTPLHAAAHAGHADTVAALCERGAQVNARADMGQTPLHLCAAADIARILVAAGADPTAVDDEHETPPLTWARVGIEISGESPARRELVEYLTAITPE